MSHNKSISDDDVLMGRNHWDVPVRVELRAYLRFGRRLDRHLQRLVLRWAHTAAPHSRVSTIEPLPTHNKE
jgi:hypothetical protein